MSFLESNIAIFWHEYQQCIVGGCILLGLLIFTFGKIEFENYSDLIKRRKRRHSQ